MTISRIGVCKQGKVPKQGEWTDDNGRVFHGIAYARCEECGGKGCGAQSGRAELDATLDGLSDKQLGQIAKAVRQIVGPGA